jgi:hypothetical protein
VIVAAFSQAGVTAPIVRDDQELSRNLGDDNRLKGHGPQRAIQTGGGVYRQSTH